MAVRLGWFGEDAWDFVSTGVSDVFDTVGDFPGVSELTEASGDFARTSIGKVVLRALSSSFYGSIAWTVGPQLATVAWAVPGLMRGEPFESAWFDEVKYRTEKTAEILAPGIADIFAAQLKDTLLKLGQDLGVGNMINEGVKELAARYRIREDVAAFVKSLWNKIELPDMSKFDPATGRALKATEQGPFIFRPGEIATTLYTKHGPQWFGSDASSGGPVGASTSALIKALGFAQPVAAPAAPPPVSVAASGPLSAPSERRRLAGDVLLGVVVVAAAGALYVWWRAEKGRPLF